MTNSLFVLSLWALGLIAVGAGLCIWSAHIPGLDRITGAAPLHDEPADTPAHSTPACPQHGHSCFLHDYLPHPLPKEGPR